MSEHQPADKRRQILPKDVFERANMPSRWERLTGVTPKIAEDKVFLAFMAARYRGEERLPDPGTLVAPKELCLKQTANMVGGWAAVTAAGFSLIALAAHQPIMVAVALVGLIAAVAGMVVVSASTATAVAEFLTLKARCAAAHARLHADSLDPQYRSTLDDMITCDEGTLAYCAAKIASEIQRQVQSESAAFEVILIDLWDELAAIGASAREIAQERAETERLERSRLRNKQQVRETISEDNRLRETAIALLAARVYAFADYRDRLQLTVSAAWREKRIASRAMRLTADELAAEKSF